MVRNSSIILINNNTDIQHNTFKFKTWQEDLKKESNHFLILWGRRCYKGVQNCKRNERITINNYNNNNDNNSQKYIIIRYVWNEKHKRGGGGGDKTSIGICLSGNPEIPGTNRLVNGGRKRKNKILKKPQSPYPSSSLIDPKSHYNITTLYYTHSTKTLHFQSQWRLSHSNWFRLAVKSITHVRNGGNHLMQKNG